MKLLWIPLLLAAAVSCRPLRVEAFDCKRYHRGKFYYKMDNHSGLGHWKEVRNSIYRNDSSEWEISEFFIGDTTEFYIQWLGECKYELTLKRTTNRIRDSILKNDKEPFIYTIIKGTDDYYIFNFRKRLDTIWIKK